MTEKQIGYDRRALLIDGERTLLLSGAIHYPRSTPAMWPELIRRSREAGLNTIETYVFWNLHEAELGVYDFSDRLDLVAFCREAQRQGMHVILRIGPYICAEINFGGFPAWLRDIPGIQFRTINAPFMAEMERWVRWLCAYLDPLFAGNGGPIILAQIENEYGLIAPTYGETGQRYLGWAIELGRTLEVGVPWVMCVGGMPGAIETINGFYGHEMIDDHHAAHPDQPSLWTENWPGWYDLWGYPHHTRAAENVAYGVARFVAAGGTGVNYYMWHGGTNFGRESMYLQTTSYDYDAPLDEYGLETTKSRHAAALHRVLLRHAATLLGAERAVATPLGGGLVGYRYAHAGHTLQFVCNDDRTTARAWQHAGRSVMVAPRAVLIIADGEPAFDTAVVAPDDRISRAMQPVGPALAFACRDEPWPAGRAADGAHQADQPIEQLRLTRDRSDYCWYSTTLAIADDEAGAGTLVLGGAADLVYCFIDGVRVASGPALLLENRMRTDGDLAAFAGEVRKRYDAMFTYDGDDTFVLRFPLTLPAGAHRLDILCCAVGMVKGDWQIGFQNMAGEAKGLWRPVSWNARQLAGPWTMWPGLEGERTAVTAGADAAGWRAPDAARPLRWWRAQFSRPGDDAPLALDLAGMGKGLAWLNGRLIGRYWLIAATGTSDAWLATAIIDRGVGEPTQRYYHLPAEWLADENTLVLFEETDAAPETVRVCAWH